MGTVAPRKKLARSFAPSTGTNMKTIAPIICALALTELLLDGAASAASVAPQEIFPYEDTRPVVGMPEIRAVRLSGEKLYRPVAYRLDLGGWVLVADSFTEYQAARERGLKARPTRRDSSPPQGTNASPTTGDTNQSLPVLAAGWSPAHFGSSVRLGSGANTNALSPFTPRPGDDPSIRVRCGDEARAQAAILRLRAMHLPVTQANMNLMLEYASTPACPYSSGGCNGSQTCSSATQLARTCTVPASETACSAAQESAQAGNATESAAPASSPRPTRPFAPASAWTLRVGHR
jgi:hypothetical protein